MTTEIPGDFLPFVERMVSEKRFLNVEDLVAAGLRLLQSRETLREEVRKGFDQLDAGKGISASEVFARINDRISQVERA